MISKRRARQGESIELRDDQGGAGPADGQRLPQPGAVPVGPGEPVVHVHPAQETPRECWAASSETVA